MTLALAHLSLEELDLIRRLLVLRRAKLVGPILAEYGKYWICDDEFDLQYTKRPYTLDRIRELVDNLEIQLLKNKKPVQREQIEKAKRAVNGRS